jgi:hypothetical protein
MWNLLIATAGHLTNREEWKIEECDGLDIFFEWFKPKKSKRNFSEIGHFKEKEVHEVVTGFSDVILSLFIPAMLQKHSMV